MSIKHSLYSHTMKPKLHESHVKIFFLDEYKDVFSTCGAEGPGDVQVEVVRGIDGHVEVLVGLHKKKKETCRFGSLSSTATSWRN